MLAARARVPFACMIWQVVPSTSTRKSINLDLARAARYRYFTKDRPAHANYHSVLQSHLPTLVLPRVLGGVVGWRRPGRMATMSPGRSASLEHRTLKVVLQL